MLASDIKPETVYRDPNGWGIITGAEMLAHLAETEALQTDEIDITEVTK